MAASDIVQVISHYQKDIEKICSKPERALKYEDRLLHCLTKLHKLPVTVNHLQVTGVGKTVNSLRKLHGKKGLGEASKALVAKWKAMVIEEDEEGGERAQNDDEDTAEAKRIKLIQRNEYSPISSNGGADVDYKPSSSSSTLRLNEYSPQSNSQATDSDASYSPSKKPKKPNGYDPESPNSNDIQVYCYSPSKKTSEDKRKSENKEEKKKVMEDTDRKSRKEKSSRKDKSESREKSNENKQNNFSKLLKKEDLRVKVKTEVDDEVDFMSGASFAEALGPIIKKKVSSSPVKKKIKVEESTPTSSNHHSSNHSSSSSAHHSSTSGSSSKHSSSSSSRHISSSKSSKSSTSSAFKEPITPKQLLDDVAGPSHLAPLDLDVVSTLSVPTPNYRPMPQPPLTLAERRRNNADEEDALAKIMSNKNSRTKVYSGVKGGLSFVPSLYEICCRVLQQHIDALEYTGGIPYNLLKPVVDSSTPRQLEQFEHFNPYIMEDTDHLWQYHVSREFRGERREEMETWREMYQRCKEEREMKYHNLTANIKESIKKSVPVRQTKLAYVDVAKPPRNILKKQMKNGTSKPDAGRLLGMNNPDAVPVRATQKAIAPVREIPASFRLKPKVAPLMQKTLKSIKSTHFRR